MEKVLEVGKRGRLCPDEIVPTDIKVINGLYTEYEEKYENLIKWFWERVDVLTTGEEKAKLYDNISDCCKKYIEENE